MGASGRSEIHALLAPHQNADADPWGDEDKIISVQQTETWRKFLPQADIKVYRGAGHLVHLEKPEAVNAIATFLS